MSSDSLVIVAAECRVPGANDLNAFRDLLMHGQTGYSELPLDRGDRSLYFDREKGRPGKSYTTLGGVVPAPSSSKQAELLESPGSLFDPAHIHFAQVAKKAWQRAGLTVADTRAGRTGVYVGHSGGTRFGGDLSLSVQIEETLTFLDDIPEFRTLSASVQQTVRRNIVHSIRHHRPRRDGHVTPRFEAYQAASLAATALKLTGPRVVLDAACASSLTALSLAMLAIQAGRIETAIVGGATYNSVDNLILFSHSQACTERDSRPFDDGASGLVSSEGYVAIVVMKRSLACRHGLAPLAEIRGLGIASDGRGRSLWAPRKEGQILALRRAYDGSSSLSARQLSLLDIDYQEAHATSTQLGDATELETLQTLMTESPAWTSNVQRRLPIGSAKSNIGHTLEAAGLIGISKVLLAMQAGVIPPSVRYETPNRGFEWNRSRIDVVDRPKPWTSPVAGRAPMAAVSAFGIGGLNAHVVIQQSEPMVSGSKDRSSSVASPPETTQEMGRDFTDPVVIVGRGVVLPGAMNIKAFEQLLNSSATAITDAPESRWRSQTGVQAGARPAFAVAPHCRAGYVRDFAFDGAKYRIPPKQVQQANPLQMMFLDAVRQAIEDCYKGAPASSGSEGSERSFQKLTDFDSAWPVNRQRVGVVIGTIFGGEFGDQLQAGMRLPEIERELLRGLGSVNVGAVEAKKIADNLRRTMLATRPALLDETGSFTASTLASRIAKTFDLMGGACALDSDDASGMNALISAVDQLNAGAVDLVVCGAGTRALNLSLFELLDHQGRLLRSGNPAEIPSDLSQILPGEGAAVVLLCRRSTAVQAGLSILVTVSPSMLGTANQTASHDGVDLKIARKTGYLPGAHSLVRVVAETLTLRDSGRSSDGTDESAEIISRAQDGQVASIRVVRGDLPAVRPVKHIARENVASLPVTTTSDAGTTNGNESGLFRQTAPSERRQINSMKPSSAFLRLGAVDADSMLALVESLVRSGTALQSVTGVVHRSERSSSEQFSSNDRLRVILPIGHSKGRTLDERLAAVAKALRSGRMNTVLDRDLAVIWKVDEFQAANRVAWLFPGQGSHYPGQPSVLAESQAARERLEIVDAAYEAVGFGSLSSVLANPAARIGEDLWWSQSWGLGLSCCLVSALREAGLQPDVCLGHSLGEFSAAFAARVLDVNELAHLARARAQAVMTQVRVAGGLLSVRASASEIDAVLREGRLPVEISHLNSPKQTVVAGTKESIAEAQKYLDNRHIASMPISVPAPFHTQLMLDAERVFGTLAEHVRLRVPTTAFLSATSVRYLSEPQDIRQSLVRQLTKPVMYLAAVERLLSDDVRVLIEVGPNDVLTRLTKEIVGQRALCLSADVPDQTFEQRLALIHAAIECVTGRPAVSSRAEWNAVNSNGRGGVRSSTSNVSDSARSTDIKVFDVTRRARKSASVQDDSSQRATQIEVNERRPVAETDVSQAVPQIPQRMTEPAAALAMTSRVSSDQVRHYLKDLIVELTGYSPDIVEPESDLEADLGIDSIKRAQILGELASWLGITVRPNTVRFDRVRTLNDAVALALELSAVSEHEALGATEERVQSQRVDSADRSAALLPSANELDQLLIAYVCDQTGYSPDVVDVEADLEADLGLDSIKLAQLIGEIRSQFSLQHLSREMVAQARFRTLLDIREFLLRHGASEQPVATKTETVTPVFTVSPVSSESVASRQSRMPANASREVRGHASVLDRPRAEREWAESLRKRVSSVVTEPSASSSSLTDFGREHRVSIRETLRHMLPGSPGDGHDLPRLEIPGNDVAILESMADGAGVDARSLYRMVASKNEVNEITQRYLLRVIDAPIRSRAPEAPEFHGRALILGDNPLARCLREELGSLGVSADIQSLTVTEDVEAKLADLWARHETPHLFLTMAFDEHAATDFSCKDWEQRRPAALELPFRVCQLWMQRMIAADMMDDASVVAVTRLGGDYGFSGRDVQSFEAIGGLIKAMLIESWMRGFRTTPMKVVDASTTLSLSQVVKGVLRELAVPSYDMEIALGDVSGSGTASWDAHGLNGLPVRRTVQAIPAPLKLSSKSGKAGRTQLTRGGTWVVTGGGRGISAAISQELALKYGLKLRLLGTAPRPQLSAQILRDAESDMASLRRRVMQEASAAGHSPIESWRRTEKSLEIHRTLTDCAMKGIDAQYYCCDVSDVDEVNSVLQQIRRQDGSIQGIIHGAGFGQDSRFDRKRPDKVRQCLKAKIDGTIALMEATMSDRLEWFVAFGSISGRFGANGHTDYSLANDMMAKIVDRYRMIRPETRSVTFHWHAWGDIGMATKPEARLALEMIDMRFMPAVEGMSHFLKELESGGDESEVLITDEEYFRKFFPADRLASTENRAVSYPLVASKPADRTRDRCVTQVTLNPVSDAFLAQHRVNGRPVLPFVVAMEMMAETASLLAGVSMKRCVSAAARQALRFATDDAVAVVLEATWQDSGQQDSGQVVVRLLADVRRRDGRLVEEGREYFRGVFSSSVAGPVEEKFSQHSNGLTKSRDVQQWSKVRYAVPDAAVWHGPVFQELRKYRIEPQLAIGRIAASAPVQLFGGERSVGFLVPCSTFDACLYLIGLANVQLSGRLSLPVEFHDLQLGRLPDPGEPCDVRAWQHGADDRGATWSFELTGQNGDSILKVRSYRTGWLSEPAAP